MILIAEDRFGLCGKEFSNWNKLGADSHHTNSHASASKENLNSLRKGNLRYGHEEKIGGSDIEDIANGSRLVQLPISAGMLQGKSICIDSFLEKWEGGTTINDNIQLQLDKFVPAAQENRPPQSKANHF